VDLNEIKNKAKDLLADLTEPRTEQDDRREPEPVDDSAARTDRLGDPAGRESAAQTAVPTTGDGAEGGVRENLRDDHGDRGDVRGDLPPANPEVRDSLRDDHDERDGGGGVLPPGDHDVRDNLRDDHDEGGARSGDVSTGHPDVRDSLRDDHVDHDAGREDRGYGDVAVSEQVTDRDRRLDPAPLPDYPQQRAADERAEPASDSTHRETRAEHVPAEPLSVDELDQPGGAGRHHLDPERRPDLDGWREPGEPRPAAVDADTAAPVGDARSASADDARWASADDSPATGAVASGAAAAGAATVGAGTAGARTRDADTADTGSGTAGSGSGTSGAGTATGASLASEGTDESGRERLVSADRAASYGARWDEVKGEFVDEPRKAVAHADALVGELLDELGRLFDTQRRSIEHDLDNDEVSTEELRVALRRYRSFFDRLLSL
jgi:hypothetical protein